MNIDDLSQEDFELLDHLNIRAIETDDGLFFEGTGLLADGKPIWSIGPVTERPEFLDFYTSLVNENREK